MRNVEVVRTVSQSMQRLKRRGPYCPHAFGDPNATIGIDSVRNCSAFNTRNEKGCHYEGTDDGSCLCDCDLIQ